MNIKPKLSRRPNELIPEVSAQPVWRNIATQHSPTMQIKPFTQSTGKRLRSPTENKTVLPGGSRKLYISARKVIELWIETRAVISWVTPTTAFLMRQLIIASRLGRTEYQLLLMKISWWDRNVKIRYKCLVVIDEFLTVSLYQPNEFISWSHVAFHKLSRVFFVYHSVQLMVVHHLYFI